MRKKATNKRKRNLKEEKEASNHKNPSNSSIEDAAASNKDKAVVVTKTKRTKTSKPVSEPEFFEEKRNLEDLWQQVFPVGTEGQGKVTCIPVVVAVVSPFPPSDKIGVNSVQREAEEILPMKQMKMDWVPYIPLENRDSQVERLKSQIFILSCTQRRAASESGSIHEWLDLGSFKALFKLNPCIFCEFDWELDELEEFTDKLIEEEELTEDQKDAFKDFVKEKVREGKKANREAREARRKALAEMSEETKAAFEKMRFYKFYPVPSPDTPDVSSVKV
ncbi:hypothetical protein LguiB_016727 [Lonicera macranthoides]